MVGLDIEMPNCCAECEYATASPQPKCRIENMPLPTCQVVDDEVVDLKTTGRGRHQDCPNDFDCSLNELPECECEGINERLKTLNNDWGNLEWYIQDLEASNKAMLNDYQDLQSKLAVAERALDILSGCCISQEFDDEAYDDVVREWLKENDEYGGYVDQDDVKNFALQQATAELKAEKGEGK